MNPTILAGLLKRVYHSFSITTFENRLKLQKYIYLLQEWGLNLGYEFTLYLHGPYCTELTRDGFQVKDFKNIDPVVFAEKEGEDKFKKYLEFFNQHKNDTLWLEIASTIHLFRKLDTSMSKEDIILAIKNKDACFKDKEKLIDKVWKELNDVGLI